MVTSPMSTPSLAASLPIALVPAGSALTLTVPSTVIEFPPSSIEILPPPSAIFTAPEVVTQIFAASPLATAVGAVLDA